MKQIEAYADKKRVYVHAQTVIHPGVPCPYCGNLYGNNITNTFRRKRRRHVCRQCGKPFNSIQSAQTILTQNL